MHWYFVSTSRGSPFMTELLSAVCAASRAAGQAAELVFDEFPPYHDGSVYVVIPHEFHTWGDPAGFPDVRQCACTIAMCTENPGTPWFEHTCQLVAQFAAAISINRSSATELTRRGIPCEHIQLGYVPQWDAWHGEQAHARDIDVLYLGAADVRRDPLLAALGGELWARRCQFLVPPLEPRTRPRPDFLMGEEKYQRLRSTRVLLNMHRTASSALEWMRFLEAICNGCVVVSEPCVDGDPLMADEHYVAAEAQDLAGAVERLLDDPERLRHMRMRAYDFVRHGLSMEPAIARLSELSRDMPRDGAAVAEWVRRHGITGLPAPPPRPVGVAALARPTPDATTEPTDHQAGLPAAGVSPRVSLRAASPFGMLARVRRRRPGGLRTTVQTAAYASAQPRVTLLLVGKQMGDLRQATARLPKYRDNQVELLILQPGGKSGSSAAAEGLLEARPSLPAKVQRTSAALSAGAALNLLMKRARGEYVFVLDAKGGIYPSTLERLMSALDADGEAMFAFPMVAIREGGLAVQLAGSLPWEPDRLKGGNWIDAMALVRREQLVELGGFSTDRRLAGWEAFDLWCRCAQRGRHGAHVPQVLAWRAASEDVVDESAKWALMRERFPRLLAA
jgi:hypothetical protein